jgi:UDP-N-acetylglucosamine enolpyruvyl transferase
VQQYLHACGCRQGKVHACATNGKHLVGGNFCLDYPSVGATETLMMAAALADGKTMLSNVAQVVSITTLPQSPSLQS